MGEGAPGPGYLRAMKRAALGGAHRGPVAPTRQRRTIRFVQTLLVLFGLGLLVLAGFAFENVVTFVPAAGDGAIDAPREPSLVQPLVLVVIGLIFLGGAALLGWRTVRIPTPARLEELVGRAESVAVERAEEAAKEQLPEPSRS